jgi:class 3 adenylate cyclase/tetratricopeptide (TPR) repeat protein
MSSQQRKTVTLVFCDLVGSTAIGDSTDPEVLEGRLRAYIERMQEIVERHGGTVEKFIGDAVMAVFGVPVAHEDDALRAVHAAAEMRDAMPELQLQARIGVNTGEILTSKVGTLVTGDAVNVAARLEQAAAAGEVLIGKTTQALIGSAAEAEEVDPLDLKGKAEPVPAFRLLTVGEAPARTHSRPFVGRRRELELVHETWARAVVARTAELVTVVGEAGVGKSRLVGEALADIDARVVSARCLPYGDGITYWPVVEVVKQLRAEPSDNAAAAALRSLLGESNRPTSADEIAWAFRKLLEEQAPLVVGFDDLQWGEETFLDLVESTALLSAGSPVLLLCMARPELLDRRPTWPAPLRLEPLRDEETDALIGPSLPDDLRRRIADASGGNPLFITEMLALSPNGGELEVPPTLRALLAARLDQLEPQERLVLERGAVEGEIFHRGAVQALAPEEPELLPRLAALVRHQLIRPERAQLPGDDGFRFRHLLIRDAAYDALPKAVRADLHRRFADWLAGKTTLVEVDELVGYHLEQAVAYQAELGKADAALALRAADRLLAAGRRALDRDDTRAAEGLLDRALTLTRPLRADVHAELDLARAVMQDPTRAAPICEAAAAQATEAGDETGAALAGAMALHYRRMIEPSGPPDELERLLLDVRPRLEQSEDHEGLAQVWWALGFGVANGRGLPDDWAAASLQAWHHSRLAGRPSMPPSDVGAGLCVGTRPADQALELLDNVLAQAPSNWLALNHAWLLAMLARGDEARQAAHEAYARVREQDDAGWPEWILAEISTLADDHEDAERRLRVLCDWIEAADQRSFLEWYIGRRARSLCFLGRFDEAEQLAERARVLEEERNTGGEGGGRENVWREALARVYVSRGELVEAERLARDAVAAVDGSDYLVEQGNAFWTLAEVLAAARRDDGAAAAFEQALDRCARKKNLALAAQIRRRMHVLGIEPSAR